MADNVSPKKRSEIMARIRSAGMLPERRLGALLTELVAGLTVVERPRNLPGRPDFYIPSLRLAVFADGCFFHGCPKHCRIPQTNRDYWLEKIRKNVERDRRVRRELRRLGVRVVRVWEHDLQGAASLARRKLKRVLAAASAASEASFLS